MKSRDIAALLILQQSFCLINPAIPSIGSLICQLVSLAFFHRLFEN